MERVPHPMTALSEADRRRRFETFKRILDAKLAEYEDVLTPGEVAKICRVDPKTVTRWSKMHKVDGFRTLGGHRRFYKEVLREHLIGLYLGMEVDDELYSTTAHQRATQKAQEEKRGVPAQREG